MNVKDYFIKKPSNLSPIIENEYISESYPKKCNKCGKYQLINESMAKPYPENIYYCLQCWSEKKGITLCSSSSVLTKGVSPLIYIVLQKFPYLTCIINIKWEWRIEDIMDKLFYLWPNLKTDPNYEDLFGDKKALENRIKKIIKLFNDIDYVELNFIRNK